MNAMMLTANPFAGLRRRTDPPRGDGGSARISDVLHKALTAYHAEHGGRFGRMYFAYPYSSGDATHADKADIRAVIAEEQFCPSEVSRAVYDRLRVATEPPYAPPTLFQVADIKPGALRRYTADAARATYTVTSPGAKPFSVDGYTWTMLNQIAALFNECGEVGGDLIYTEIALCSGFTPRPVLTSPAEAAAYADGVPFKKQDWIDATSVARSSRLPGRMPADMVLSRSLRALPRPPQSEDVDAVVTRADGSICALLEEKKSWSALKLDHERCYVSTLLTTLRRRLGVPAFFIAEEPTPMVYMVPANGTFPDGDRSDGCTLDQFFSNVLPIL